MFQQFLLFLDLYALEAIRIASYVNPHDRVFYWYIFYENTNNLSKIRTWKKNENIGDPIMFILNVLKNKIIFSSPHGL